LLQRFQSRASIRFMAGGAMAETLISMVVFIPLFASIPVLGNYMDIKQKALEATRYAAWERTIWAGDNGIGWGDGQVNIKSEQVVIQEIDRRFYGHPLQGLDDSRQTENPLWGIRQGGEDIRFLGRRASDAEDTDSVTALRAELPIYDSVIPDRGEGGAGPVVGPVAHGGLGAGGLDAAATGVSLDTGVADFTSIAGCELGISLSDGLSLGRSNRINLMLETPINNVLGQSNLMIRTTASILSNAWVVPGPDAEQLDADQLYRNRVGRITAAEPVDCLATPVAAFAEALFDADEVLLGEVRRAAVAGGTYEEPSETADTLNPYALPQERIINSNARN